MSSTVTKSAITLKGSAQLVSEFFQFGIQSILYQRGVYPADHFKRTTKYGLTLLVSNEPHLTTFLQPMLDKIQYWLERCLLRQVVIVMSNVSNSEIIERWQFDVQTEADVKADGSVVKEKSEKKIRQEMADVIRQITASVTFLPLLECQCSFDVLIYTSKEADTPEGWEESGPCTIVNGQEVQLRSFDTAIHKVDTRVAYKNDDD